MGLDMYLHKKTYVKNWKHMTKAEKHSISVKKGGKLRSDIKKERISEIVEEVAYWRKANAIHRWFVENVQNGEDDCREYYVDKEQLAELVKLCKEVLSKAIMIDGKIQNGQQYDGKNKKWEPILVDGKKIINKNEIDALLPTQSGFFFGNTEYNEYYYEDLKDTVSQLEPLLAEEDGSFYYQSSW